MVTCGEHIASLLWSHCKCCNQQSQSIHNDVPIKSYRSPVPHLHIMTATPLQPGCCEYHSQVVVKGLRIIMVTTAISLLSSGSEWLATTLFCNLQGLAYCWDMDDSDTNLLWLLQTKVITMCISCASAVNSCMTQPALHPAMIFVYLKKKISSGSQHLQEQWQSVGNTLQIRCQSVALTLKSCSSSLSIFITVAPPKIANVEPTLYFFFTVLYNNYEQCHVQSKHAIIAKVLLLMELKRPDHLHTSSD